MDRLDTIEAMNDAVNNENERLMVELFLFIKLFMRF